jgi:hypothetical protein
MGTVFPLFLDLVKLISFVMAINLDLGCPKAEKAVGKWKNCVGIEYVLRFCDIVRIKYVYIVGLLLKIIL